MAVVIEDYPHRTGEHCASTAMRNLLAHHGLDLSEGMVFGLSGGLGFFYLKNDELSPTRMFHGRTSTLEIDFARHTRIAQEHGQPVDDDVAWEELRARIDQGIPVMLSTDTFYLGYQNTTSHFPKHRAVAVGYDVEAGTVMLADRKLEEYQVVPMDELRRARNADDYPMSCGNEYDHFRGRVALGCPLREAIGRAIAHNVGVMRSRTDAAIPNAWTGVSAMRRLSEDFESWTSTKDWSWSSRFGYQVVVKRGAGGHFFRSLYADFLRESASAVPALGESGLPESMQSIAERWVEFASVLKEQSERETCDPALFGEAGRRMAQLADLEESIFGELAGLCERNEIWTR